MLNEFYYKNVNHFIFNKINSKDYGLLVDKTQGVYGSPKPVIETVNVPGRGNLIINKKADPYDNDEYEDIPKSYNVHIVPDSVAEQTTEMLARAIYRWLYGAGTKYLNLEDSYEPNYYRKAYVAEMMSVERIAQGLLSTLTIEFTCQAYKYLISGLESITLTNATGGGVLYNPEGFTASPLIKVIGSGNIVLYINDREHHMTIPVGDEYIMIDSERMNSYRESVLKNANTKFTYYPKLVAGANDISWSGNVSQIDIIPRWCTL